MTSKVCRATTRGPTTGTASRSETQWARVAFTEATGEQTPLRSPG